MNWENFWLNLKIIYWWDFSLRGFYLSMINQNLNLRGKSSGKPFSTERLKFNSRNINLNSILRGHTLDVINAYINNNEDNNEKKNKNLASYLAGLIKNDGAIHISKTLKCLFDYNRI